MYYFQKQCLLKRAEPCMLFPVFVPKGNKTLAKEIRSRLM
jgi:hypothetical protein